MSEKNKADVIHLITIHNNDGQMVDYEHFVHVSMEGVIFPEILKKDADWLGSRGNSKVWMYDKARHLNDDQRVALARHVVEKFNEGGV